MKENLGGCKRIVVKYGGSSLADHERMLRAVAAVVKEAERGTRIAVVVSAMGNTTDVLLHTARNVFNGKVDKRELDDILSMGERTSIRIFAAALKTNGVESRYFDPLDDDWPIITDDHFSNANPLLDECERRIQKYVLPLIERNIVPVIAGFVGRTVDGKITTLGRGGSDTTAFILASALKADEVILVTDVDGIMSADPKLVKNVRKIQEIDINTLVGLADSGAKFIHSKALKYKPPSINVRVINHADGNLDREGTLISGALSTELDVAIVSPIPVASITVVGRGILKNSSLMHELSEKARAYPLLYWLSSDGDSMIFYVGDGENLKMLLNEVHETILKHREVIAMSVKRGLAFLRVNGVGLEEKYGVIGKISEELRINEVNIFGISTITSSILLFVDWNEREKALSLIKDSLRGH
ncbi:MAG: aspartate kinase [Candidatus Bathyarchaeia archaeon]